MLGAPTPEAAFALFKDQGDSENPADRYGLALAEMRLSLNDNAERIMRELATENPTVIPYRIGQAEALMAGGSTEEALKHYRDAVRLFPRNVPLTISYAEALIAAGQASAAHALLLDLLNNVEATPEQLRLIARAANAEGDVGDAYYYMSYYYGRSAICRSRSARSGSRSRRPASIPSSASGSRPGSKSSSTTCRPKSATARPDRRP